MNLQIWPFASFLYTYMYNNIYKNNTIFIDVWCIFENDWTQKKSELFGKKKNNSLGLSYPRGDKLTRIYATLVWIGLGHFNTFQLIPTHGDSKN